MTTNATMIRRGKRKDAQARPIHDEYRSRPGRQSIEPATQREQLREFLLAMSAEMSELAFKNGFDSLAVIFDMAREAVESEMPNSQNGLRHS